MQPNEWPNERTERLIELYHSNVQLEKIAEELGVSRESVSAKLVRLRRAKIIENRTPPKRRFEDGPSIDELAEAYNECGNWGKVSARFGYKSEDRARQRYYRLLAAANRPMPAPRPQLVRDDAPAPPPLWRDMGKGAQAEYDRAAARVERMVAAGDDRSAAINQVLMEMGVRVR